MTASIEVHIEGREQLVKDLQRLRGPELNRVIKRSTSAAMEPVLSAAQGEAPVDSGRLRASLGELAESRRNATTAKVGVRRDFSYVSTSGGFMAHGRGKQRDRALQHGFTKDTKTAQQYARVIHFGVDKDGRVRRKAGAAPFLEEPLVSKATTIIDHVANDLRAYVENH